MLVMKENKRVQGFTLLEIVVSLGILSMLGIVLTQSFVSSVRTSTKGEITQEVIQNGNYAVEVASRILLNSSTVLSTCATGGTSSSSFEVTNPDGQNTTFGCVSDSGVLRIASSSAFGVSYLTSNAVTLSGASCASALTFVCKIVGDGNTTVKMTFSLLQKNADARVYEKASFPFELFITLRNYKP